MTSAATLPGVLDEAKKGSALGLVVAGGGPELTHAQLIEQVELLGAQLRNFGVKAGDLVTLAFPNTIEFVIAFLAVARVRAVAAPLNAAYKEDEFTFYIEDAKSSFLLIPNEGVPNAEAAAKTLKLPILIVTFPSLKEGVKVATKEGAAGAKEEVKDAGPQPKEGDEALFLHTSGTTSRPKGVPLTHLNLATSVRNIIKTYELTPEDKTLIVMPLFHVHGLMASLLATLSSGGTAILPAGGRFSATTFWDDALSHQITWYTAVPTIHQILLAKQKSSPVPSEKRPKLRFIRSCSSPLSASVLHKLEEEFEAPVLEAYAMTEASHQMTSNPLPKHGPHKPGTVGKATGIELTVLDEQDRPVPTGEIGEVSIKGANVTKGYKNNPDANKVAFTSGWFHTGDRGKLDSEGFLTLTGRIKELINRGGEKISPLEVDEALLSHPAVSEAVAFAAPDEKYGEEVNAAVVLSPNEKASAEDILAHIKDRLSAFKLPKKIFIATEMPRTATGKIQRRKVAEHFLGAAEKAEKAGHPLKEVAATSAGPSNGTQEKGVNGADLVARSLAKMGVKYLFGVVGIPVTALATFAQKAGIRFIGLRNEQAAGYAAGAAGYLTGVPGALLTVSGPGAVHGLAGLSNGLANCWPIVMISGSAPTEEVGRGGFQELDQLAIVKPFVKYAGRAENVKTVPEVVQSAVSAAAAGRPGAAYVDVPAEVLHQEVSESETATLLNQLVDIRPFYTPGGLRKALTAPPDAVDSAVRLLRNAKSPLIVFGKGAAYAQAEDQIRTFVQRTGIPFVATPMGKGLVPDEHPLNAGAARSLALGGADVALIVGAQLNWLLHFGEPPRWNKDVKFIQIDISEDELKLRKPAVSLLGDATAVLEQINVAIKDEPFSLGKDHPWVTKLREKAEANGKKLAESLAKDVVPMNFQCSMRVVRDELEKVKGPHPILVSEGANTMDVGRTILNQNAPRTRLDAGTWGTMGVGMGYAIAAAVVNDGKRLVVAVEGDSAFGFSAAEVEVLVRYNLPVVVVVFNNSGIYGGDRREDAELGGPYATDPAPTDFVSEARYEQIIEAFGGKGYFVRTPPELAAACQEAFAAKKPAVINVIIDPFAGSESGRMHSRN